MPCTSATVGQGHGAYGRALGRTYPTWLRVGLIGTVLINTHIVGGTNPPLGFELRWLLSEKPPQSLCHLSPPAGNFGRTALLHQRNHVPKLGPLFGQLDRLRRRDRSIIPRSCQNLRGSGQRWLELPLDHPRPRGHRRSGGRGRLQPRLQRLRPRWKSKLPWLPSDEVDHLVYDPQKSKNKSFWRSRRQGNPRPNYLLPGLPRLNLLRGYPLGRPGRAPQTQSPKPHDRARRRDPLWPSRKRIPKKKTRNQHRSQLHRD